MVFTTHDNDADSGGYEGSLRWNPGMFSLGWFQRHRKEYARVFSGSSLDLEFDCKPPIYPETVRFVRPTCMMEIKQKLPARSARPLPPEADAMKAWNQALDAFESRLH